MLVIVVRDYRGLVVPRANKRVWIGIVCGVVKDAVVPMKADPIAITFGFIGNRKVQSKWYHVDEHHLTSGWFTNNGCSSLLTR
jgi:hypothetical protein